MVEEILLLVIYHMVMFAFLSQRSNFLVIYHMNINLFLNFKVILKYAYMTDAGGAKNLPTAKKEGFARHGPENVKKTMTQNVENKSSPLMSK